MQSNEQIIAYGREFARAYAAKAKNPGLEKILDSCDDKITEFQKSTLNIEEEQMFSLYEMIGNYSSKLKNYCRKDLHKGEIFCNTIPPEEFIEGTSKDVQEFDKEEGKIEEKAKSSNFLGFLLKPLEEYIRYFDDPEKGGSENSSENLYLALRFMHNMIRAQKEPTEDYFRRIRRVLRWMPDTISTEDYSFVPISKEVDKLVEYGDYLAGPEDKGGKKSLKQKFPELFKDVVDKNHPKRDTLVFLNLIFENPYKPANNQEWETVTREASFYDYEEEKEETSGRFRVKDNDRLIGEDPRHEKAYRAVRMAGNIKHGKHRIEYLKTFLISDHFSDNVQEITDKKSIDDYIDFIRKMSEELTPADSSEDDPSRILHDQ